MIRNPRRLVRLAAVGLAGALSLAACSAPDVITPGTRPNQPTTTAAPSVSPETDPAKLALPLTKLPGYTAPTSLGGGQFSREITGGGTVSWSVLDGANKVITDTAGNPPVAFGDASTYSSVPGVLAFRGNNYRNAPAYGTAAITEKKLSIAWTHDTGDVKTEKSYWAGAGWTGQPLLVNWPKATKEAMGLSAAQIADPNFVEVVYSVVDGKVYRMDLATGTDTKPPLDTGFGFKGSGSIDPRGYPLLYVGMGLNENGGTKDAPWRYRIIDLIQNKDVAGIDGPDPAAPRTDWGAFDSSPLINAATDTLIEPAENGLVYKLKLNSSFDAAAKTVSVAPTVTKLRYTTTGEKIRHGIESSAAAYRNLMFAGDNDGYIVCWDATTLQVVWTAATGDDTDATPVLTVEDGHPYLFVGNEYDKRGQAGGKSGPITIQKLDALTGAQMWKYEIDAVFNDAVNGGTMATPAIGFGEVSDLVFFNIAKTLNDKTGTVVALDTKTGTVAWKRDMAFGWSSPVLVQGDDGHVYGVLGDSNGVLHLFNPATGADYSTLQLEKNIEASPAVYGNMLVVGTYAKKLYGIKLS